MPFLSWAKPTSSQIPRESPMKMLSPSRPTLKPSYSQVVKTRKIAHDPSPPRSRALPHDQIQGQSRGIACATLGNKSQDQMHYRHVSHPLIGTWKTMGTNQRRDPQQRSP